MIPASENDMGNNMIDQTMDNAAGKEGSTAHQDGTFRLSIESESGAVPPGPVTAEALIARVMGSIGPRKARRIPREMVEEAVATLDLTNVAPRLPSPRLRVVRLTFTGTKCLTGGQPQPFRYDQRFAPGVNVVLIPDNDVGKSSILKTIKYALTGDDGDFDQDVKSWIRNVWLQFSLDDATYTVHLAKEEAGLRAYLVLGAEERGLEAQATMPGLLHAMSGGDEIGDVLHRFFFQRLALSHVGWTQGTERRSATWRTFFQALLIPDGSDGYLICDAQHATGGQDNLILSVFLGLTFTEPINQLLIERQTARKENEASQEEVEQAQAQVEAIRREEQTTRQELARLDAVQRARRQAVTADDATQRLADLRSQGVEKATELSHLEEERGRLTEQIRRARARARNVREHIQMHLHFTGLDVHLCPSCDTDVDEAAMQREQSDHSCRLCGKKAHTASASDIEAMAAEADAYDDQVQRDGRAREHIGTEIERLRNVIQRVNGEAALLEGAAKQGIEFALSTPQEDEARMDFQVRLAELRVQSVQVSQRLGESATTGETAALKAEVQEVIRGTLRQVAEQENEGITGRLGALTQEMARDFGAQSITDVTCSALGRLSLNKHGVKVAFKGINNPGERLRVKLAFFLAMMRLGRLGRAARHPGLLLIDQPASAEMVTEDVEAVARSLAAVDAAHAEHLQIICFTARTEFAKATDRGKVYGPQAGPYAF